MKDIKKLIIKNGGIKTTPLIYSEDETFVLGTSQLESLINEVISQRAGEPVAEINFYGKVPGIITHEIINQLRDGTKLYALNIL